MELPFTVEQFLERFEAYNRAVFPFQAALMVIAILAVFLAVRKVKHTDRIICSALALLWLWSGIIYHLMYFTKINKAAYGFAILFILQGILFLYAGFFSRTLAFQFQPTIYGFCGSLFLMYSLILYPLLGQWLGHQYPRSPTFGLPCPVTIFTWGMLLWTSRVVPRYLLVIPMLWSLIGFSAAVSLTITQDYGLLIAGLVGCALLIKRDWRKKRNS